MNTIALIVAAGRGTRLGAELPKQYLSLAGVPMLRHSVEAFLAHPEVDAVRVVIDPADREHHDRALRGLAALAPVAGGASRQQSVRLGLESLTGAAPDRVLIHDAARPFVDANTISATLAALGQHHGALPGLAVADSLKRAEAGLVTDSVDRAGIWRAQTPQVFRFADILAAHREAEDLSLTDDAAVATRAGLAVAMVPGTEANFKVTDEADMARARRTIGGDAGEVRVGNGFDVHRFEAGDHVMLCGVAVPHDAGLKGHSDADVGLHALTDAVLGTIGAGDIGQHFPPSEPEWRGAPSEDFLRHAAALVVAAGGCIAHVDLTLILERPKVGPHRDRMRANVARILDLAVERVSVKATTTERLGFLGRGEGIAAQATATVRLGGP
ncbi:MAG: bifunctional 2-C-methyl-D-erythritol 4-phosphate cytidylyltransferase/2-C-methyl-D-erythritol 2,4-cyclodiphosphate synthase [Alphaproteobacteria bacterium]|nr:bifunctional 2-C-methyl-D-erythritol 4-phosphate cytidylyltransferase/2-C-methyl-D-erythritol 2,4-cyclodiphosphate synthase [Alphaproteobacteria bacterium]